MREVSDRDYMLNVYKQSWSAVVENKNGKHFSELQPTQIIVHISVGIFKVVKILFQYITRIGAYNKAKLLQIRKGTALPSLCRYTFLL